MTATVVDNNYSGSASGTFVVNKADQTITFASIPNKILADPPFTVSATSSSRLPVVISVVSGPATINGNLVTLIGAGTVTMSVAQAGDTNYNAAATVKQSFVVAFNALAAIANLATQINALNLTDGEKNSLTAKLDAAYKSAGKGDANAAVGQLRAFINEVAALARSGRITSAVADVLKSAAQTIITGLQG